MVRHEGRLYAATGSGLHRLSPSMSADGRPAFKPVPNTTHQTWSLLSTDEGLLVASTPTICILDKGNSSTILANLYTFRLYRSRYNQNLVFLGLEDGLGLLQKVQGRWQFVGRFAGISHQIRTIVEEAPGVLWLGTRSSGFLRTTLPAGFPVDDSQPNQSVQPDAWPPKIERFGKEHGVPNGMAFTYRGEGRTMFATQKGLRRFDEESHRFLPDSSFGVIFADTTRWIYPIHEDQNGDVWITSGIGNQAEAARAVRLPDEAIIC